MIKTILLTLSTLIFLNGCGDEKQFGQCTTEQDAMNMMIASQAYGNTLQHAYLAEKKIYDKAYNNYRTRKLQSSEEQEKLNKLQSNMAKASQKRANYFNKTIPVSRMINAKKYQEACDTYIEIAGQYNFDIEAASKNTLTMAQLGKDGGKSGGKCGIEAASVALMFFIEDARKSGNFNDKKVQELLNTADLDYIQNPSRVCNKIEKIAEPMDYSYSNLMQRVKQHLAKNKARTKQMKKIIAINEKKNKNCSLNDAIELSYKSEDYLNKYRKMRKKWFSRYNKAENARLQNSALIKRLSEKRKEVDKLSSLFIDDFKAEVKPHISDGKYDLACSNYAKVTAKHDKILAKLTKEYNNFGLTTNENSKTAKTNNSTASQAISNSNNNDSDPVANKKYGYLVDVINKFSPKIYSSFKTYANTAGTDAKKRQKNKVTNLGGINVKLPNNYIVQAYYGGSYKANAIKALQEALVINRISYADKSIKNYLDSINDFTKLFTEAAEYYEMKDYTDDDFKKADEMHPAIVAAFTKFTQSDNEIRDIVNKIADNQTQQMIEAYKASNQMLFYYVENAQYLAKKYYRYASHKPFLQLDEKQVRVLHDKLRAHYKAFITFKQENETVFKDNSAYSGYLRDLRNYVASSKDFYLRVKSKKAYPNGEEEMLKHVPPQARAAIEANLKGSIQHLLKAYNSLVDEYNGLNM